MKLVLIHKTESVTIIADEKMEKFIQNMDQETAEQLTEAFEDIPDGKQKKFSFVHTAGQFDIFEARCDLCYVRGFFASPRLFIISVMTDIKKEGGLLTPQDREKIYSVLNQYTTGVKHKADLSNLRYYYKKQGYRS